MKRFSLGQDWISRVTKASGPEVIGGDVSWAPENHCEKHFNFKGQCCPVCLLKAKEDAEAALKEALEELEKAQQRLSTVRSYLRPLS